MGRWLRICAFLVAWPTLAHATSDLCLTAGSQAAQRHDIPITVMHALTLVETGRTRGGTFAPWPWTMNVAGKGEWFATRADALRHARAAYANGSRSFDLGCYQINHRWHGSEFASFDEMIDPAANADYAARYLRSHFAITKDWVAAAGRYHSRTPVYRDRYAARFAKILADVPVNQNIRTSRAALPGGVTTLLTTASPMFAPSNGPLIGTLR